MSVHISSSQSADGLPYTSYSADISAFAGQTGELEFTADENGHNNYVVLDDISFSTQAVPEPNTLELILMAGVVFGLHAWRNRNKVAQE